MCGVTRHVLVRTLRLFSVLWGWAQTRAVDLLAGGRRVSHSPVIGSGGEGDTHAAV